MTAELCSFDWPTHVQGSPTHIRVLQHPEYYLMICWYNLLLFDDILMLFWCISTLFWYLLIYVDFIRCYFIINLILIYFGYVLILFDDILSYFDIVCIFEEAGPYRARRGAGNSFFGAYLSEKNAYFHTLQYSSDLRNSTPWPASSRRCDHTNSRQHPVHVALFREKSLFSRVYRGATASGTVSRVPGRSTCIGHTKDELRRPYGGRVVTIWNFDFLILAWAVPESAQESKFRISMF